MNFKNYKYLIDEYRAGKISREQFCWRWAALQDIDEVIRFNAERNNQ